MGLGSHFHPKETRSPFHQFQRLPTTTAKGIRNLVVRADAALYAASQAVSRTRAAASQATIKGNYAQVDDVRVPANKLMRIKVATLRTPVVPVREHVREPVRVPVREHVREPVMSRMRMRIAAEAAVNAKANVGGSNKKPLKKHLKKLVKKPIKKVVKKPLVKPARKKVATRRISK